MMHLPVKAFLKWLVNRQKPPLYLHIGLPKTGTSTIQGLLFDNPQALRRHGYFYPPGTLGGESDYAYAHHTLAHAILENNNAPWQTLQQELANNKFRSSIISSEAFANCREQNLIEQIHAFLQHFPVKIVIYIRRQDEFLEGLYQTHVTYGDMTIAFSEYLDFMLEQHLASLDYYFLVNDLFANEFGKENILLRVYEKSSLHEGDLLKDFLKTTGFKSTKGFDLDVPNTNLSLDARSLEIYRKLKMSFNKDTENLEVIRRYLRDHNKRESFQNNNIMTQEQSRRIMTAVQPFNEKLAKEYLGRDNGELFRDQHRQALTSETVTINDQEVVEFLQHIDKNLAAKFRESVS